MPGLFTHWLLKTTTEFIDNKNRKDKKKKKRRRKRLASIKPEIQPHRSLPIFRVETPSECPSVPKPEEEEK